MIHPALITAALVQGTCQVFKLVYYSFRDRRLTLGYLVTAGGMPSAHSAFVSALTGALGVVEGLGSAFFALSFVFSAIVVFDSLRLRAQVQELSERVNRLSAERPLSTMVGHSMAEVVVGVLVGLAGGVGLAYLLGGVR